MSINDVVKMDEKQGEFFKVKNYKNGRQITMDYSKKYISDLLYNGSVIKEKKKGIIIKV